MSDTCGKENTVCAMVECCPGFVCQSIEGNLQYHIVLSLSLSKDMHYNRLKGHLQYHIALLLSNDSNYDLCAICLKKMGKLHFTLQLSHTTHGKKSASPVVRQFVHNINTMISILHDNEEDICWRMFREKYNVDLRSSSGHLHKGGLG